MRNALRVIAIVAYLLTSAVQAEAATTCRFVLGFGTLASLIPQIVGQCVEDEGHNPANGDALQQTTTGLLVWRKADNWTAFTDGFRTWINGPTGLQQRLNTQRFPWEANPDNLPLADTPASQTAPVRIRQPQPYDLVDDPVQVAGIGTGFEGTFSARVRDATGKELARQTIHAGGTGILGNFAVSISLAIKPTTAAGTLEVFDVSAKDGSEIDKVTVPVTFGIVIVNPYHGFAQYTVAPGDSLAAIARRWYGDASKGALLLEANRDTLTDADQLRPGQVLRIPQ